MQIIDFVRDLPFNATPDLIIPVLVVAYAVAGLVLLANLYKHGFLNGNLLGITAAILFFLTALTYFANVYLIEPVTWEIWVRLVINTAAFAVILIFLAASFRAEFVGGGYKALLATKKQLQQQEKWMWLMQEHMTDGLAVYSLRGELLYINPAALKMLNVGREILGTKTDLLCLRYGKTRDEVAEFKRRVLNREIVDYTIGVKDKHGQLNTIHVRLNPVRGTLGSVIGIAGTYRDITDIRQLERAKEEFIQVASHELRTPITAVQGFLSLLKMDKYGGLTLDQRSFLDKALLASLRVSKLVDNLLLVAKFEEAKATLNLEQVDVVQLISSVTQELDGEAGRSNVKIRTLLPSTKIPTVYADREKLFHIVSNLVSNAIKYTREGGHVFIEPVTLQGRTLEIRVTDTGVGIAPEDIKRLFNKFERITNQQSVRVGGSGLGLVIVKSYTELHGGHVFVDSQLGRGSTFTVSLPLRLNEYTAL